MADEARAQGCAETRLNVSGSETENLCFKRWGIGTPELLVLLVTKEHLPLATEEIPANVAVNNQRFS